MSFSKHLGQNLTIIMAGGQGERLYPLTRDRAKPAVPFGGIYRVIDFTLSNCLHSGLRKIEVLTQYKSLSLARHLNLAWDKFNFELGEYIHVSPPQHRLSKSWYQGTADAIYQNIYTLERARPKTVLILSGDHIYKMDYRKMIAWHLKHRADVTIGAVVVPRKDATQFGVIEVDKNSRVVGFAEKPANPKPIPGERDKALASMGIYVFNADALVRRVVEDAKKRDSSHDFGKNVIPAMVKGKDRVVAYSHRGQGGKTAYWRDIGTLDAYGAAHMDLLGASPAFRLNDPRWPIWTSHPQLPPARATGRTCIHQSIVSGGCMLHNASIHNSVLSPGVRVGSGALIEDSIVMNHTRIGSKVKVRKAIIDKGVNIPGGATIDGSQLPKNHSLTVTPGGMLVIPKEEPL